MADLLCAARCGTEPRQAAPGYRLCWGCKGWLTKNLDQLADLAPDLEAALSRTNVVGEERVGGTPGHGLELNDQAAAARWQIHHDMGTTIRLVHHERGLTAWPADNIADMAKWLGKHADWLAAHLSAGERAAEASDWVNAARNAINPDPPKRVQVGPCVRARCSGVLTAIVRKQDSLLPSSILCSWWCELDDEKRTGLVEDGTEPHTWTPATWHALGRQMRKAAEAVKALAAA